MTATAPIDVPASPARVGVRLLEADPDLGRGIPPDELAEATRLTVTPIALLSPGMWDPAALLAARAMGPFAGLVLDGMIARESLLGGRVTTQLIGPGDVLPLAPGEPSGASAACVCRVAATTRLVVLDERFLAAARRWPWLTARMVERAATWADRALVHQSISQLPRVDTRIVAFLWLLAERWGRVTHEGVLVPLTLTHGAIGSLVGAQRPTVTLALTELAERGVVERHDDGWLLAPESQELAATASAPDRFVTASLGVVPRHAADAVAAEDARRRAAEARGRAAEARGLARAQRLRAQTMRPSAAELGGEPLQHR